MKFDYQLLKGRIKSYFPNQADLAKELNVSRTALSNKLNNKISISCNDIYIMINLLNIKPEEIKELFFKPKC